eukprot:gene872-166_t
MGSSGGGVVLYIHQSLNSEICQELMDVGCKESVWCKIDLNKKGKLRVGLCYRSPSSTAENNEKLMTVFSNMQRQRDGSHLLCFGDYNLPEIKWGGYRVDAGDESFPLRFYDLCEDLYLVQHVTQATRFRHGNTPSNLDLIFTNEEHMIDDLRSTEPLGKSDHVRLLFQYVCYSGINVNDTQRERYNYWKGDYVSLQNMLSEVTWENEMGDMNVDESWYFFRDKVITAIKDYIPLFVPKKPNAKPPYWNKSLTRHVRKKYNLFRRWERTGRESHYKEYAKQRNMTSKVLRKNERLYERSLTKEFKEKPKQFYGYVRNKVKKKANVPQLKRSDGSMTESDQQKASVFVEENTSKLPDFDIRTDNIIEDIEFTVEDVKKKLDQLKEDKAAGPDCIPPKFLKELRNVLALPLYLIFRKSLDESYLPSDWKTANISSIFKRGSKKSPGNYRPISLTSVACKIMESIIRDAAVEHSNKNGLFCSEQHGLDVGVWISDDLKPSTQCSKAAAKASSSLGFIKRAFKHIDKDSFALTVASFLSCRQRHVATRGNGFKLYKAHAKRLVRDNFFSQRVINAWNNLPNEVVRAKSVPSSKRTLISIGTKLDMDTK